MYHKNMKGIKITINKEFLDLPNQSQFEFKRLDKLSASGIPTYITEKFQLVQIQSPENHDEWINYVVKLDDQGCFDDLLKIAHRSLDTKFQDGLVVGAEMKRIDIKKLPAWKRLFNKF